MRPLMTQPPRAPVASTGERFSGAMPPMAHTGMVTARHTSRRKGSPLGASPFLQSVANTWPAVI